MKKLPVFLILCCIIWACGEQAAQNNADSSGWQEDKSEEEKSKTDTDYLEKIARSGMFEVEISRIATKKATMPEVKELALMMIKHHTAMNEELAELAEAKEISLPAETSDKKMEKIRRVREKEGMEFDKQVVEYLIRDHEKNIESVQKIAENTKDADIKAWAIKSLPVLKKHLEEAKKIDEMMSDKKSA